MKKVISFTLFGSADKYCKGLLKNIEIIKESFPAFEVWVYVGDGVPEKIMNTMRANPNVRIIETGEVGLVNKFHRFFAIDDHEVEVMFVRDADSRIYARDISVMNDFLASDKLFHIVRDHPNHTYKILAGCFGIKKGLLNAPLRDVFNDYRKTHEVTTFWNDQEFLATMLYPYILGVSFIHDELHSIEPETMKAPIKAPILQGLHFIGQVYEYDEQGNEYPKFTDYFEGGQYGKEFWTADKLQKIGKERLPQKTKKIHLFIQVYVNQPKEDDSDEQRQKITFRNSELDLCFTTNLSHDFVERIYIFYEKDEDMTHYKSLANGQENRVTFIKHWRQAFYKDFLLYIKDNILNDQVCCLMATDIHFNFDIDLSFFDLFLPVNTVFGLTRHEPTNREHTICNKDTCVLAHSAGGCGDCFMFRTPVPSTFDYDQVDHRQNRWGGECNFLDAWHRAGAQVFNPCYQVKTIHQHKDSVYLFTPNPVRVVHGRPYLPELEPAPKDSNHCINRPSALYAPGTMFCFRCKSVPNAFCKWHNGGRDWTCNICEMYNRYEDKDVARTRATEFFKTEPRWNVRV